MREGSAKRRKRMLAAAYLRFLTVFFAPVARAITWLPSATNRLIEGSRIATDDLFAEKSVDAYFLVDNLEGETFAHDAPADCAKHFARLACEGGENLPDVDQFPVPSAGEILCIAARKAQEKPELRRGKPIQRRCKRCKKPTTHVVEDKAVVCVPCTFHTDVVPIPDLPEKQENLAYIGEEKHYLTPKVGETWRETGGIPDFPVREVSIPYGKMLRRVEQRKVRGEWVTTKTLGYVRG